MHGRADGVADVLPDDRESRLLHHCLHGPADVVEPVAVLHLVDPGPEALLGHLHEGLVHRRHLPDGHGEGGVGVVALHDRSAVDGQDVALGQPVVPRDPMDDHVIG